MRQIILNENLILSFELISKKVKLAILEDEIELVSRKESFKDLLKFSEIEETKIFKGRLQLYKHGDFIEVVMKNKPIAIVATKNFIEILNSLK